VHLIILGVGGFPVVRESLWLSPTHTTHKKTKTNYYYYERSGDPIPARCDDLTGAKREGAGGGGSGESLAERVTPTPARVFGSGPVCDRPSLNYWSPRDGYLIALHKAFCSTKVIYIC
jgi:hypothetical protein